MSEMPETYANPNRLPDISTLSMVEQQQLKTKMIESIVRSKRMQGEQLYAQTEVMTFPEIETLESKSLEELRSLRFTEISWRKH